MPRHVPAIAIAAVLLSALARSSAAQDARRPKKLIETGWDMPDSDRLPELVTEMETRPFDGAVVQVLGRGDKDKKVPLGWAFQNEPWRREWFDAAISRLKSCKFKRLTDNFVCFNANPGDVDWFDDAGWKNIVEHWRIAAWVARQSGFKGILFDPEPYAPPHSQFHYASQPQRDKHTFQEYCVKARQRGREVMQAVATEYPDITLHCYFMNSVTSHATGHADPRQALAASGYGLYPAFIDGWLDAAPPTITLVDGCESAYRYNSRQEFLESAMQIRGDCQEFVSPENRAKYRAQVQAGFGIYLDAYWNPKDSPWHIDGLGGPRVERLRANVRDALHVADEYVWIYGEKFRWWPTPHDGVRKESWPDALPGCDRVLDYARDPLSFARAEIGRLKQSGKLINLARNGDFSSAAAPGFESGEEKYREGGMPAGWHAWQEEKSKGTFTWDRQTGAPSGPPGSARIANVVGGCLIQAYRVSPGQRYVVAAARRIEVSGQAAIRVRWQTADERWTAEARDKLIYPESSGEKSVPWSRLFGIVEVPEGVGRMLVLLGASGQATPSDVAWYDDVEVYRLE